MLNPAEALFERDNPLHAELLDASRSLTLDYAARSAPGTSLVLTDPLADGEADAATFGRFQNLAARRAARLMSVVLEITPEQNVRRLQMPSRTEHRKLTRPETLLQLRNRCKLLRPHGTEIMTLDITCLSAEGAAARIPEWIRSAWESTPLPRLAV